MSVLFGASVSAINSPGVELMNQHVLGKTGLLSPEDDRQREGDVQIRDERRYCLYRGRDLNGHDRVSSRETVQHMSIVVP